MQLSTKKPPILVVF